MFNFPKLCSVLWFGALCCVATATKNVFGGETKLNVEASEY